MKVRLIHEVSFVQNSRWQDDYLLRRVEPPEALQWLVVMPDGEVIPSDNLYEDVAYTTRGNAVHHGWIGEDDSHVAVSLAAAGYTLEELS